MVSRQKLLKLYEMGPHKKMTGYQHYGQKVTFGRIRAQRGHILLIRTGSRCIIIWYSIGITIK